MYDYSMQKCIVRTIMRVMRDVIVPITEILLIFSDSSPLIIDVRRKQIHMR